MSARPFQGVEFKLDEDGEVLIQGDPVFAGYYGNPRATEEVLSGGWLHTGDVGRWIQGEFLRIMDRKKDIIITAGGKILLLRKSKTNSNSALISKRPSSSGIVKILVLSGPNGSENVGNWAQNKNIPYTTYKSLATLPEVGN